MSQDSVPNWRIKEWFPKLSDQIHQDLRLFHVELLRFNDKMSLISTKTIAEADLHHFADSIAFNNVVKDQFKGKKVYDIGSGNGFPGVVLAILNRDIEFVLLDSDMKKLEFLKHLIAQLKLEKVKTQWARVEDMRENEIDFAVSRGFAPLPRALMLTRKVFKIGGVYLNMKSLEWPVEVASLPPQICSSWDTALFKDYELPAGKIKLSVLRATKTK